MAAGTTIQLKRKAGAFTGGDLAAGESGVDTTNGDLYFSPEGSTVVLVGDPSLMDMAVIGSPTYSTVQHLQDIFHSSGATDANQDYITDATAGNIDVAAGTGLLRATDSPVAELAYFNWSASAGNAIPSDTTRYVGVEYNAGSPQVVIKTSYTWDLTTEFPLGKVVSDAGVLHITNDPHHVGDHASLMIQRAFETMPVTRDKRGGGLMLGESGTRNISVTAGAVWERLRRFSITALDTSVTGSFDSYYRDGAGGWTKVASETQWDNDSYDDGTGVLGIMTNNRYAALYFYVEVDDSVVCLYGQNEYANEASAEAESPPSSVPDRLADALLIGRYIFKKSASTTTVIESAFGTSFAGAVVSDHGNLAGLADDDHTQYLLADGTRALTDTLSTPAGIWFTERADHVETPTTTKGELWVKNTAPNTLIFTDDAGTDTDLTAGGGGGLTQTATKTAAYTAVAWDHVIVDNSAAGANFEITMPASPSLGDQVRVTLVSDNATYKVTLDGDTTDKIETDANNSPDKYSLILEGDSVLLEWVGGDCGWSVIDDAIIPHSATLAANANITTNTAAAATLVDNLGTTVDNVGGVAGTNRLTVRRDGMYIVASSARPYANVTDQKYFLSNMRLNGASYLSGITLTTSGTNPHAVTFAALAKKLSTSDYIELIFASEEADKGVDDNAHQTYLSIAEIR